VIALEALRRGTDAARDDLAAERLAVLSALEPLRGLSEENQRQLALGCAVLSYDANQTVVRQGQAVDALHVVLEGEIRLMDDPDDLAAPPAATPAAATAAAAPSAASSSPFTAAAASGGAAEPPGGAASSGGAASGGGAVPSLRARRAVASLAALSLLGPGGSFGEGVLGYPEDPPATAGGAVYGATAVTSRACRLIVLP
ncbi:hypothetical protein TSOC_015156, partial [Tetrabaena socialis]